MPLFVSYARKDHRSIQKLKTHLTILGRQGFIQHWDDTQLVAGEDWNEKIMEKLDEAGVVLLVYSNEARASKFIQETEAPRALALAKAKKCTLIVVPLDRKDWHDGPLEAELKKLQTATWNAQPVLDFKPQRNGWMEVEQAIRKAVEQRRRGS